MHTTTQYLNNLYLLLLVVTYHNIIHNFFSGHGEGFLDYDWADNFTPAHFIWMSKDGFGRRYGLIRQIDGKWTTKGSPTYETRGLCSRASQ